MAQAARSLPPAPGPPRGPQLRLVGALPPPRSGASPQTIRRRRLVVLAGLVALAGVSLAWLALTGPPAGDAAAVSALLRQGANDPATLCDHLSAGMLRAAGGRAACVRASPEHGPGGTVRNVRVEGSTATATVGTGGSAERVRLVRRNGTWKVDDIR